MIVEHIIDNMDDRVERGAVDSYGRPLGEHGREALALIIEQGIAEGATVWQMVDCFADYCECMED